MNNKRGLIKSNFLNLPFQSNSFDLVWSPSFIDEVPNQKDILEALIKGE